MHTFRRSSVPDVHSAVGVWYFGILSKILCWDFKNSVFFLHSAYGTRREIPFTMSLMRSKIRRNASAFCWEKVMLGHIENVNNEWCIFSGVKVNFTHNQLTESEIHILSLKNWHIYYNYNYFAEIKNMTENQ